MARNTKVLAGNRGKPITAFFALANKSSRQPGSSPNASSPRLASQARGDTPPNGESSSKLNPSNNHLSTNVVNDAKCPTSGPMSPRRSERVRPASLQSPALIPKLKRTREPDTQLRVPNLGRVRTADRRKSKFDSGSEDNTGGAVIYVTSPRQRKKARISPSTEFPQQSDPDMVPSSQSDEEELATADGASTANRGVTKRSNLPTPHRGDEGVGAMAVDDNHPSLFQDEAMKVAERLEPAFQITQMLTPPLSDLSSPPPTPIASAKKSTRHIIANIKARAYAKSFSSPESDQFDFQDVLDSSEDEQLPTLPLPAPKQRNMRRKGKQTDTSTRYSLRNRSSSPFQPSVKTQAKPSKKGSDPFTALLKEKHLAERCGNGNEAIEKAELTVLQYGGKDGLLDEMEDEEGVEDVSEWGTNVSSGSIRDILNARNARKDDSDLELDEGDKKRILEEEGGKTVLNILEEDKAERCKTGNDKISGIRIWTQKADAESSAMAVDEDHQISGDSPVVRLLNNSLTSGATIRTNLLLKMNLMPAAQPVERAAIASCLLDISLSSNSSLYTDAAVNTLSNFWSSSMQPSTSTILFKDMLKCLKHFGVDSQILASQNWEIDGLGVSNNLHNKGVVISRLVTLITACARSCRLRSGEILDISIAMMLIGMDAGTSPALQRDLSLAIDLSIQSLSSDDLKSRDSEFACALRVLQMSASYSPVNKLRLLSLLSNGSGSSRRIADFVAYCMITDKQCPTANVYTMLPPLAEVLDQLHCSKPSGIFALHEGTDYIDLGFYVAILGVAVSNVKGYVSQERQKAKSASLLESPSKMGDKPKTDLQLLHGALEALHSKISDSRATHLERSRTKAAVKQLAMNVHYQREFWLRHSRENKSVTLAQYFRKKN